MANPNYFAVIPASVRYDNEVSEAARFLYGEITALANQDGVCTASNDYFASLYDKSKKTVSRWISELEKHGHIHVELVKDNKNMIVGREIRCAVNHPFLQLYPIPKNGDTLSPDLSIPMDKFEAEYKENNIYNNNPLTPKGESERFEKFANGNSELLEALHAFEEMRKKQRKPMTDRAKQLLLKKLQALAPDDVSKQIQIVDQSTLKGWSSVFPLDEDKHQTADPVPAPAKANAHNRASSKRWV